MDRVTTAGACTRRSQLIDWFAYYLKWLSHFPNACTGRPLMAKSSELYKTNNSLRTQMTVHKAIRTVFILFKSVFRATFSYAHESSHFTRSHWHTHIAEHIHTRTKHVPRQRVHNECEYERGGSSRHSNGSVLVCVRVYRVRVFLSVLCTFRFTNDCCCYVLCVHQCQEKTSSSCSHCAASVRYVKRMCAAKLVSCVFVCFFTRTFLTRALLHTPLLSANAITHNLLWHLFFLLLFTFIRHRVVIENSVPHIYTYKRAGRGAPSDAIHIAVKLYVYTFVVGALPRTHMYV